MIGEQKEITDVSTINFKILRGCRQAYHTGRLVKSPTSKLTSSPTLYSVLETWEMVLLHSGGTNLNGIRKQSLQRYESNRWYAVRNPVENIPRNHNVEPPREDSKSDERLAV